MKTYTIDNGLIVDSSTVPPTCCGYIMQFEGHGAFSPDGKVEFTKEQTDAHNALLAQAEWQAMLKHGKGLLYISTDKEGQSVVSDWPGVHKVQPYHSRSSFHNFAGKNGRTDVWFSLDGSRWHGVNIGDSQICHVKRCKR